MKFIGEGMKYNLVYLILTLLLVTGINRITAQEENKALDDVVVKETYEAGAEEEKMPIFLDADFSNLVEIKERIYWSSVPWKYGEGGPSTDLFECRISQPEFARIIPAPAKVFHLNFKDLGSWKLDIFTSDGSTFRSLSGEGDPPRSISWDGRSGSGQPLVPGEQYAYSFTATDKAGNRRTFPGEGFTVPALYLTDDQGVWIGLSNVSLFSPDGYGLSKTAEQFSNELVNFIYYYGKKGTVKVRSSNAETEKFLELMAQKLGRDVSFFQREPQSGSSANCFMMWVN
jgi:hypothetical protein